MLSKSLEDLSELEVRIREACPSGKAEMKSIESDKYEATEYERVYGVPHVESDKLCTYTKTQISLVRPFVTRRVTVATS